MYTVYCFKIYSAPGATNNWMTVCVFWATVPLSVRPENVPRYLNNHLGVSGLELYAGVKSEIRGVGQPPTISLTVKA